MRSVTRRLAVLGLLAVTTSSCARCSKSTTNESDAGPEPFELPDPLPLPKPWKLYRAPANQFSLPTGCVERAPPVRGLAPPTTRFVAEPRALATLIVGESRGNPPELVAAGALSLGTEGSTGPGRALPWVEAGSLPKLARGAGDAWVAAIDMPAERARGTTQVTGGTTQVTGGTTQVTGGGRAGGGMTQVILWRDGKAEALGEGDGFAAIDLACVPTRCALLTTRMSTVAQPGASLWIGAPTDPASAWKRTDIALPATATTARPLAISRLDAAELDVALLTDTDVAYWSLKGDPHEVAHVPADHGVVDVGSDPFPTALTLGVPVDEDGCPKDPLGPERPSIRIQRAAQPAVHLKVVAPPSAGAVRRVGAGTLVLWVTPAGCRSPHRAAYAIVLDAAGKPLSETPTTLGEATGFAIATSGADVDMWFQDSDFVTWLRARCDVPTK